MSMRAGDVVKGVAILEDLGRRAEPGGHRRRWFRVRWAYLAESAL